MITVQINCKITENIWNVDVEKYIFPQIFTLQKMMMTLASQTVPHCEKEVYDQN